MFPKISLVLMIPNLVLGSVLILSSRKRPGSSWAWLLIVFVMPIVGLLFYYVFGVEGNRYSSFAKRLRDQIPVSLHPSDLSPRYRGLIGLNENMGNSPLTTNNHIKIYHQGQGKFSDLIDDIKAARFSIYIQYYIMNNDELGRRIINILADKAGEGLEIRLLTDKLGSRFLSKKVLRPLVSAGGKVAHFAAPHLIRLNFRNHRKLAVIDGNVGYIGGFNVGNEYLGKGKYTNWRDCHIRIVGDAVAHLQERFLRDFSYANEKKEPSPCSIGNFHKSNKTPDVDCFKKQHGSYVPIQIVSSGPDTQYNNILYAYIKMIQMAKRSVYIQTPYFVPHESIQDALITACKCGVAVHVMIPANPDHPFVYWAAIGYLWELIQAGAKCYQYNNGFVHSKLVIVDSCIASVGTANMDIRSLKLNFEINAFLYNAAQATILEKQFIADIENSTILDYNWYSNRNKREKAKEALCRLLSPVL